MSRRCYRFLFCLALLAMMAAGCTRPDSAAPSIASPSAKFTSADVSKLKWIEGTWRGMDGDKPFFERYKIESNAMIVESFDDGTFITGSDITRFELKDGVFGSGDGDRRSIATSITDDAVQFVPEVAGRRNSFRFERRSDGSWNAIFDTPASGDTPAQQKVFEMRPWKPGQDG